MSTIVPLRLTIPLALMSLVFLLYSGTFDLGFFSDDFEGIARYQKWGLGGLGDNYGNVFFMPFSFLFQAAELQISSHYAFIKVINLLLFGGTAIFLFSIAKRIFPEQKHGLIAALISALIFICSPYQTEAINWFSSQAYLLATFFSLWALWILVREKQNKFTPYYFNILLFFALLNKEVALCVPLIGVAFLFFQNENDHFNLKKSLLGSILVLLLYFILRRITLGEWIGGYGEEVHTNFDPGTWISGLAAYGAKFFGFYRYLPGGFNKVIALGILALAITTLFITKLALKEKRKFFLILGACFLFSLLPVLNLETSFLENIQSDRYGYFPSAFFALLAGSLFLNLNSVALYLTSGLWLSFSILLLLNTQNSWIEAAHIRNKFIYAIRNSAEKDFYLLNVPDNYCGVYIFRHGLKECFGNESKVRPLSLQHLDGPTNVMLWNDVKNEAFLIHSSSRFVPCEPLLGQQASQYDGRTWLTIKKGATGEIPVYYFDPGSGKIYACSTE